METDSLRRIKQTIRKWFRCSFLGVAARIVLRHRCTAKNGTINNKRITIRVAMPYNDCQKTTMLTENIFLPKISVRGFTRAIPRFIALIAFFGFHSLAFSATGSIAGKVVDKTTREPLAGANIIVMDTQLGAAADVNGDFIVRNIESGSYNIEISILGYKTLIKNRVVVKPGKSIFMQVELGQEPIQMSGIVVTPSFFEKTKDAVVSSRRMDFEEIITQPGGCYDV